MTNGTLQRLFRLVRLAAEQRIRDLFRALFVAIQCILDSDQFRVDWLQRLLIPCTREKSKLI